MRPYLKYFFEIAAIVVGVTISFMVDEWRENRRNRSSTVSSLERIQNDLINEQTEIDNALKLLKQKKYFLRRTAVLSADKIAKMSRDSLFYYVTDIFYTPYYISHRNGYHRLIRLNEPEFHIPAIMDDIGTHYAQELDIYWYTKMEDHFIEYQKVSSQHVPSMKLISRGNHSEEMERKALREIRTFLLSNDFIVTVGMQLTHNFNLSTVLEEKLTSGNRLSQKIGEELNK
jgi:hypothetical protein